MNYLDLLLSYFTKSQLRWHLLHCFVVVLLTQERKWHGCLSVCRLLGRVWRKGISHFPLSILWIFCTCFPIIYHRYPQYHNYLWQLRLCWESKACLLCMGNHILSHCFTLTGRALWCVIRRPGGWEEDINLFSSSDLELCPCSLTQPATWQQGLCPVFWDELLLGGVDTVMTCERYSLPLWKSATTTQQQLQPGPYTEPPIPVVCLSLQTLRAQEVVSVHWWEKLSH